MRDAKNTIGRAVCRPSALGWVVVAMFGACVIALMTMMPAKHHTASDTTFAVCFGTLFLVPTFLFAVWLLRARIEADEHGLRWRGMGRWRTVAWADVTDYYDRFLPKGKKKAVIETCSGKVTFSKGSWDDSPNLRAIVQRNAVNARSQTWGILGLRSEQDWPRTFRYDTRENRTAPLWLGGTLLMLAGLWGWLCIPKLVRTYGTAEWIWNLAAAALIGFVLLSKATLFAFALRAARETRRHFGESITVDKAGITFRDGARTLTTTWMEITRYRILPRTGWDMLTHYEVATKHGAFEFVHSLENGRVLYTAIEQNAITAVQSEWQREEETLGGKKARWSSGCEGVGERVFHYRTRTNRAMLWLPTALMLATSLVALSGLTHPDWSLPGIMTILTLWGWARYYRASVSIGDGLTQYTIFGPRRLAWSEIEDFYLSGDETEEALVFGDVTGAGKRIRFWVGISDVEVLKQEIARHAVHSAHHTWETRKATTRKTQPFTQ